MKLFKPCLFATFAALLLATCPAGAFDRGPNVPYVQSMQAGAFYARCIPQDSEGNKGITKIYRVGKDEDSIVDHYDWYTRDGVVLAWSPIAGKVAVMALGDAPVADPNKQIELRFYLGGKFLKSYTAQDLKGWGADFGYTVYGRRTSFTVLGQEQIPGTNDYIFSIEIKGKKLSFDILTGTPYVPAKADLPK